jgi:hypothetical protein
MGAPRVKPEGDHLLVSSDIMQHTRNHLIEDLNPMEGSVTKNQESYRGIPRDTRRPQHDLRTQGSHQRQPVVNPPLGNHRRMKER